MNLTCSPFITVCDLSLDLRILEFEGPNKICDISQSRQELRNRLQNKRSCPVAHLINFSFISSDMRWSNLGSNIENKAKLLKFPT